MKFSKFIIIPVFIAAQALIMQAIDQTLSKSFLPAGNGGFAWIAFQAWAMYFLAGCNIKGGIRTFLGYVSGIVASIAIMELGKALGGPLGYWAFPAAVGIIVVPVICLEKVKWLDFVPSIFVGAGVFFGFMTYIKDATYGGAAVSELFYCLFGLVFGYITVVFRGWYEARVAEPVAATVKKTA